jgi:hypothetical protein
MTINADRILGFLKRPLEDPEFQALLAELRLPPEEPRMDDEETDLEARDFGVTMIFTTPWPDPKAPPGAPLPLVLSDVQFTGAGYDGGPPFAGALPEGIKFSDSREAVYARLGAPMAKAMLGIPNERWEMGERYLTIDFRKDYQSIKKVTTGVLWNLVKPA